MAARPDSSSRTRRRTAGEARERERMRSYPMGILLPSAFPGRGYRRGPPSWPNRSSDELVGVPGGRGRKQLTNDRDRAKIHLS